VIPVKDLIQMFQRMNEEHWRYTWGSAKTGDVDCSGAFVWAYNQYGQKIYHGSNRIAREYVVDLLPISEAQPGMAAFKIRTQGEDYYSLPQGYFPGGGRYNGDLNDYYHIGLVDEDTRYVLNAKSTADGFKRSPISENWDFVAKLKAVSYDKDAEVQPVETNTAIVTATSGGTVRMRKLPTTDSDTLVKIRVGSTVTVNESADGWAQIVYDGITGYMMSQYLQVLDNTLPPPSDNVQLEVPRSVADALFNALVKAGWG
jgi:uncharacterized protein YraI